MLDRVFAAQVPVRWVRGDSICGDDRHLRVWLEEQEPASVLVVSGRDDVWIDRRHHQVKMRLANCLLRGTAACWSRGESLTAVGCRWHPEAMRSNPALRLVTDGSSRREIMGQHAPPAPARTIQRRALKTHASSDGVARQPCGEPPPTLPRCPASAARARNVFGLPPFNSYVDELAWCTPAERIFR